MVTKKLTLWLIKKRSGSKNMKIDKKVVYEGSVSALGFLPRVPLCVVVKLQVKFNYFTGKIS